MPRIYYMANNYQNPYTYINTNGEQWLLCNKLDLYRCIITVGTPSFLSWREIRQNEFFRTIFNSIIQKLLLVHINIRTDRNEMCLHPIFYTYVSDQKRIVSYNLGMAFTKFYAEKLLDIPNLIHLETLKKNNAVTFVSQDGRTKEPDLVGLAMDGKWHVFEAKGMSSNKLTEKIQKAKIQTQQINTINGKSPATRSVCATFLGYNRILSMIEDPELKKNKKIEIQRNRFYESYYNSFFALKRFLNTNLRKETFENIYYQSLDIKTGKLELSIGLEIEIYELLQQENYELIEEYYLRKKRLYEEINSGQNTISIGIDGFVVKYKNN